MTTPDHNFQSAFLQDMHWRGQINTTTDLSGMEKWLTTGDPATKKAYVGFDPTADSLTIGNLVGIMTLARWQQAGHTPVALMGGATGLIGDPSGKSAERTLNSEDTVRKNVERIATIFAGGELFNPNAKANALKMVNNIDWLGNMGFLEALREIGKHFSVNMMIQKDSVKARLESREQGISYTEFSYMLLQAYDFFWLHKDEGVSMQMGGSDQFGNIVVGGDLIAKRNPRIGELRDLIDAKQAEASRLEASANRDDASDGLDATQLKVQAASCRMFALKAYFELLPLLPHGLTWPLVTKADGTKFGKTESGAIWLKADRTSPYAYYQFWLNAADADAVRFLKTFTFLKREEVEALAASQQSNPGAREAQRALAREATRILHGKAAMENAEAAGKALFSGEVAGLDLATLRDVFANVPNKSLSKASLEGEGIAVLDILTDPDLKLAASKREARDFLTANAVTVNGKPVTADSRLKTSDLLHGCFIAIRRGKKQWAATEWK
jgi:tyrosyl-tRNA synthetase